MLSGEGAFLYGGRWNSKGTRLVYLGSSLAQASLELLVHLKSKEILAGYHALEVRFPEELVNSVDPESLPDNWREPSMERSCRETGDLWASNQESLVLQVPSVAVSGETNYLLNPQHPDMDKLVTGTIRRWAFDSRVLKK